ncbi:MAG: DUF5655 domain-containing protein [Saprospiraceae bacterium]|nr:DUF5655 domain-containing protein [Saprospiraceae bacterium]
MLESMKSKTGRSLEEWAIEITANNITKSGDIVKFLKESHGVGHGYAQTIAMKVLGTDADSASDKDELIVAQYKGKEHLKAYYDKIMAKIEQFEGAFEVAPKKAYVSLRRKKQFIVLNPASKTRFEIGFNLKGVAPQGKLAAEKPDGICSHKISIADINEIDKEVIDWIKMAFDNAG